MKKIATILLTVSIFITSCSNNVNTEDNLKKQKPTYDKNDRTNDFYDNEKTINLSGQKSIEISGEISNPGKVYFSNLPLRSVIVKETILKGDSNLFIGAYRYDGYSLSDILNYRKIKKKNSGEFKPIIDLYVEIENDNGKKIFISWGELYYPNHLHEIIIATRVMRIVPSKTNELWELPTESKLVIASDLITERNISNPTKITVKSYNKVLRVEKGKKPLFSPKIDVYLENEITETLTANPTEIPEQTVHTIFYGRGRGIHSTLPFTGVNLKNYFANKVKRTKKSIQEGIFVIAADDGYRSVFTYSEICNRNDQAKVLLVCNPELTHNGIFRIFPSCDFFSDRAVKGITSIWYSENEL